MNTLTLSSQNKTISNADISSESLSIVESLCSEESLKFGCCEASVLKLQIRSDASVMGETFEVSIQEGSKVTSLGSFTVYDEQLTSDRCYRDIEAYNAMYGILNAEVSGWYNALTFPMTMKEFRDSFFNYFGVVQEETTLPNDSMTVSKTVDPEEISGKTVLSCICELNGCMGHVDRDDLFKYVFLNPSTTQTISNDHIIGSQYEDFICSAIDKLQIRQEENDIGVIVGQGSNCYIVQDNFLVYGKDSDELTNIANNLFSVISGITYKPYTLNAAGNLDVKLGSAISFTANNELISSYILQRTISGIQSLSDVYQAQGKQFQEEQVNSVHDSIIQLKGKTNVLKRTIEELSVTITDKENGLSSRIDQNASSISTEVTRATDAENRLSTRITETDSKITLEVSKLQKEIDGEINNYTVQEVPTLLNYPACDFTYNIPCNNTVKLSDSLKFEYNDEYYSKDARSMAWNEQTFISYRFMKGSDGVWGWREIADSEYSYVLQQVAELKVQANQISATVEENKTYTDGRIETMSSQITQTAEAITTKVSKGSVISEINQTAESVTIKAAKIDLQGLVTATEFTSKFATITSLNATNLAVSGKASIADLNATNLAVSGKASIADLNATNVNVSGKASISDLNAVSARVGSLEADHVRVSDLNATNATVASKLTTSQLRSNIASLDSVNMKMAICDTYNVNVGGRSVNLTPISVTIGGSPYVVLGTRRTW